MPRASLLVLSLVVSLGVVAAIPRSVRADRFTTHLDALEAVLDARADDENASGKLLKTYAKSLRTLDKDTDDLGGEIQVARKVLPKLEKAAGEDAELMGAARGAVDALADDVLAYIEDVDARAESLRSKAPPIQKIDKLLGGASSRYLAFEDQTTFSGRLALLFAAYTRAVRADEALARAGGGGGGGGGGGSACGPTPSVPARRNLLPGEAFTASIPGLGGPTTFTASSIEPVVGPWMGQRGQPDVLTVTFHDCTRRSSIECSIPFPPVVNVAYTNGLFGGTPGVGASYTADWDELTQAFPGGVIVTATAFDAAAKTVTIRLQIVALALDETFTVKDWRDAR